jgi:hypothetical protein
MTAARRQSEPGELPVKRNSAQLGLLVLLTQMRPSSALT